MGKERQIFFVEPGKERCFVRRIVEEGWMLVRTFVDVSHRGTRADLC